MRKERIDWQELAEKLGTIRRDEPSQGYTESGGDHVGRQAIAELLGERVLLNAVDTYVGHHPGSELARSVLCVLRPRVVMEHCYRIYQEESDIERRRAAVELLRVVGDKTVLSLVREFLSDPDETIQNWGAGLLDHLIFTGAVEPEYAEPFLCLGEGHTNPQVRSTSAQIREFVRKHTK